VENLSVPDSRKTSFSDGSFRELTVGAAVGGVAGHAGQSVLCDIGAEHKLMSSLCNHMSVPIKHARDNARSLFDIPWLQQIVWF